MSSELSAHVQHTIRYDVKLWMHLELMRGIVTALVGDRVGMELIDSRERSVTWLSDALSDDLTAPAGKIVARLEDDGTPYRWDTYGAWTFAHGYLGAGNSFLDGYVACALWSSTHCDENGNDVCNLDEVDAELTGAARLQMLADCVAFERANSELLDATGAEQSQNGHDYWLTRNGHGAGFWDRGYGAVGDDLSERAKADGECDLMLDGDKIHAH